jgi:hypothetical protein
VALSSEIKRQERKLTPRLHLEPRWNSTPLYILDVVLGDRVTLFSR